jgi:2-polyprenyl-6-methoxyphenol hydroxylase-like FAD-dependent oxidoreductase
MSIKVACTKLLIFIVSKPHQVSNTYKLKSNRTKMSSPKDLNIAIIGAGPAGLTLGRLLHLANINFTIFENEPNPTARLQGSTLDLHAGSGLLAVKKAGLWQEFQKHIRYDGESVVAMDKHAKVYLQQSGAASEADSSGRPEIDREKLRDMLLASIPADRIKWGSGLKEIVKPTEKAPVNKFELHFKNGTVESKFDLIVGSDGAWSRVRNLLTTHRPYYSNVSGISFRIWDSANVAPELSKLVNRGSLYALSDGKMLTAQYIGDGSIQTNFWALKPEDWMEKCNADLTDVEQARAVVSQDFADWDPALRAFIEHPAAVEPVARNLYMVDVDHKWDHKPGATLIGDAAHLMTPFAGEGVNLAMTDAMVLADAIIKGSTAADFDASICEFEQEMFTRSQKVRELTLANLNNFYYKPIAVWIGEIQRQFESIEHAQR